MTIVALGAGGWTGLSSDTKPTNAPDNNWFIETDLLSFWVKIAGVWTQFPTASGAGESPTTIVTDTQANETVGSSGSSETISEGTNDTQVLTTLTESVTTTTA